MGIPEPDPNFATRTRLDPDKYGSGMGMHNMGRVENGLSRTRTDPTRLPGLLTGQACYSVADAQAHGRVIPSQELLCGRAEASWSRSCIAGILAEPIPQWNCSRAELIPRSDRMDE